MLLLPSYLREFKTVASTSDLADLERYTGALEEGRLLLGKCSECAEVHHYPRSYCPFCGSSHTEWQEAAGLGRIYSYTVWRRRAGSSLPAMITLDEGPTLLAWIDEQSLERLVIGAKVRLTRPKEQVPAPSFIIVDDDL